MFQGGQKKPRYDWATGLVPWTHRRLGYPLSGCVPAEPDSVSPSILRIRDRLGSRQIAEGDAPPEAR